LHEYRLLCESAPLCPPAAQFFMVDDT